MFRFTPLGECIERIAFVSTAASCNIETSALWNDSHVCSTVNAVLVQHYEHSGRIYGTARCVHRHACLAYLAAHAMTLDTPHPSAFHHQAICINRAPSVTMLVDRRVKP